MTMTTELTWVREPSKHRTVWNSGDWTIIKVFIWDRASSFEWVLYHKDKVHDSYRRLYQAKAGAEAAQLEKV